MVSGVQSSSLLQTTRAEKAFKSAINTEKRNIDFVSDGLGDVELPKKESLDKVTAQKTTESQAVEQENVKVDFKSSLLEFKKDVVNDFKQFISNNSNYNVNNRDIDEALRYGKSILVDQKA